MRISMSIGLAATVLAALTACSKPTAGGAGASAPGAAPQAAPATGPVTLSDVPKRKPGLWTQTMSMAGPTAMHMTSQVCIDANSEAKMSLLAQRTTGAQCGAPQMTRNLDGSITFSSSCNMGPSGGTTHSSGVIKGDFNAQYTMEIDTQTTGSSVPEMNTPHHMTISAAWSGPCQPGQRGGDMILPGGRTVNMIDAAPGGAPAAGQ